MPGWHEATRELRADGRVAMVGIVQEQHPDRARLFMQWKQMDWPLLVDALDRLDVTLVPLTLGGEEVLFRDISGVSAPVVTRAGKARFAEAALFTHRGLSGPAILQASSYWRPGEPLFIDFLPEESGDFLLQAKRETPRATLRGWLRDRLPAR